MEIGKKSLFYRMNEITQTVSVKDTRLLTESKFLGIYSNHMAETCKWHVCNSDDNNNNNNSFIHV